MYQIVNDSTGIPVARFSDKGYALAWMQDNNTDEKGEYMQLYRIEKVMVHGSRQDLCLL